MKYSNFILILFFAFIGCQDVKAPEKPKDLIAKNKMVDILTEAYLANAARSVDNKSIISKGIVIDTLVYKNFGVDSLQFAKSNAYYAADVNTYIDLFQKVETRLNAMQTKMDSIQKMEGKKKDSLKNKDQQQKSVPVKDSLI
jgi:hypothetical protein